MATDEECMRSASLHPYFANYANSRPGTVEANDAITVSLVQPSGSGLKQIESFHPQFTYAIFGEEEHIFGYKGLRINLSYNASDLRPNVAVKLTRRFETVSGVEATDVVGTLKDYLPGGRSHPSKGAFRILTLS